MPRLRIDTTARPPRPAVVELLNGDALFMQMYTTTQSEPDPERFMDQFTTGELANKANKWSGRNISRWRSDDYDKTYKMVETELDPVKRALHLIKCNDLVCSDQYIIPVINRPRVSGVATKMVAPLSGWDNINWALHSWYRET